ncbi:MAG: hypothetical protein M3Y87_14515 [Myxococcota bacterium]|nr:hypothetical protein [Myxococcota bacterium]
MGMLGELLGYVSMAIEVILALVVLVLGLTLVRPVSAPAGYAIAAAGGVRMLFTCCIAGTQPVMDMFGLVDEISWGIRLVAPVQHLAFWGLLAFAAFTVAREKAGAAGQGS